MGCTLGQARVGLVMGAGWGARWGVGTRSQGYCMNCVGVYSSAGEVGSCLGLPEIQVCAGLCANVIGIKVRYEVAL